MNGLRRMIQAGDIYLNSGLVVLLVVSGVYFTIKSGFFQLRGIPFILRNTVGTLFVKEERNKKNISSFQAVTTALAGTMGVGNIAGVATALVAGGPGAIFWMWIGAFFGMMTKYAEILLAVKHRRKDKNGRYYGGPMYYMQDLTNGRGFGCVFAALCAVSSLGIGNMTQINSLSTAMKNTFQIPLWISGLSILCLAAIIIFGGMRRIAKTTEIVIPFISILYLFFAGTYLVLHRGAIPGAFSLILKEAFRFQPIAGGVLGYSMSQAISFGLSRGVFTHEAGLGSAPIAHASANSKSPMHQGVWGIFEVFLDTILVCTMTALVILTAENGALWHSGLDGAPLTSAAFGSAFGSLGNQFITMSILFFAVSAMLGWCFYGESAIQYLSGSRKSPIFIYRIIFLICILIGAVGEINIVWRLSDRLNALMALPNLIALFFLRREIIMPGRK